MKILSNKIFQKLIKIDDQILKKNSDIMHVEQTLRVW